MQNRMQPLPWRAKGLSDSIDGSTAFNGAMSARMPTQSPGKYAGQDNGWVVALIYPVVMEFNKSLVEYPSIKRSPGGASNDWRPNLQTPENPLPLLSMKKPPRIKGGGG